MLTSEGLEGVVEVSRQARMKPERIDGGADSYARSRHFSDLLGPDCKMSTLDSGRGRLKGIVTLVILAAIAYFAVKTIPVYVQNYELADYIQNLAVQATVSRSAPEDIQRNIVDKAHSLDLPVSFDNVQVSSNMDGVKIHVDYTVPIDLKVYTLSLHFKPSAENRAL